MYHFNLVNCKQIFMFFTWLKKIGLSTAAYPTPKERFITTTLKYKLNLFIFLKKRTLDRAHKYIHFMWRLHLDNVQNQMLEDF